MSVVNRGLPGEFRLVIGRNIVVLTAFNVVAIDAHDHLPHAIGLDVLAPEGELPVAGRFTGGKGEVVSAREGEGPPVGVADQRFAEGIVKVNRSRIW